MPRITVMMKIGELTVFQFRTRERMILCAITQNTVLLHLLYCKYIVESTTNYACK